MTTPAATVGLLGEEACVQCSTDPSQPLKGARSACVLTAPKPRPTSQERVQGPRPGPSLSPGALPQEDRNGQGAQMPWGEAIPKSVCVRGQGPPGASPPGLFPRLPPTSLTALGQDWDRRGERAPPGGAFPQASSVHSLNRQASARGSPLGSAQLLPSTHPTSFFVNSLLFKFLKTGNLLGKYFSPCVCADAPGDFNLEGNRPWRGKGGGGTFMPRVGPESEGKPCSVGTRVWSCF